MQKKAGLSLIASAVLAAGVLLSGVASADEDSPEDNRWIPSLSIYTAGLPEDRKASADSEVSGFQDGESVGFPWSVGGEVAIASPVLGSSKLKPRIFVHGGAGYVRDSKDPVSSVDDPGDPPFVPPFQPDPESVENQGSVVKAEAKPFVLTGGIGTILEVAAFDRTFYLRPTLEWMYRRDTIQGILGAAEGENLDINGNCDPCRILYINAQTEKGYHSLGAGLEAGIDGGRMGDFEVRFFASGRVYHILGDRKTAISPAGEWMTTDGSPTSRPDTVYNIRYEREPVHYRVGIGMRFLWQPE
jgi:hypothetical protein